MAGAERKNPSYKKALANVGHVGTYQNRLCLNYFRSVSFLGRDEAEMSHMAAPYGFEFALSPSTIIPIP